MANAYLAAARGGRNSAWRYLLCTPLALVLTIVAGLVVAKGLALLGLIPADLAAELRHVTDPTVFFVSTAVIFALLVGGFLVAIPLVHRRSPARCLGAWSWSDALRGFLIWLVALALFAVLDAVLERQGVRYTGGPQFVPLLLAAAPALLVQTFAEEYIFRGYATQGFLLAFRRPAAAAVASGVIFAALHIPNGLPQAANALAVGIVLSLVAIRTGGIAFGLGLHFANNLFGAVAVVANDDVFRGAPALFTADPSPHPWVDVGLGVAGLLLVAFFAARPGALTRGGRGPAGSGPAPRSLWAPGRGKVRR